MDIPLPGEEIPLNEIQPPDIPMPDDIEPPLPQTDSSELDDSNRYSPSLVMEDDDLPLPEPVPTVIAPLLPPPPPPPALSLLPTTPAPHSPSPSPSPPNSPQPARQIRNLVLGKTQAKKRLLAFSMAKQGGGTSVSFNLAKKPTINKESAKGFTEEKEEGKKKPPKKGTVDKARDTISEIEELKRKEMQMLENTQSVHPGWGFREAHSLTAALPLELAGNLDSLASIDISGLVGEVLAKKMKREAGKSKEKGRSKSPSDDRRRSKSKRSEKERSRKKLKLPNSWNEFKKEGHKIRHFRRFKYEVEKDELRDKKRHKRSRSRSRSRDRPKKIKDATKSNKRINLLETPMVIKKVLVATDMRGTGDKEYPEHLVHYTKIQPHLSYCESPMYATYHLPSRKQMLSTVPRDIEEIILAFFNGIRSKRFKPKAKLTEKSEEIKSVIGSTKQEDDSRCDKSDDAFADLGTSALKKDSDNTSCQDIISQNIINELECKIEHCERSQLEYVDAETDIISEAQLVQTEINVRNVEEHDKINETDDKNEQGVDILKDEVEKHTFKESPAIETPIISEVCNLIHRSWYQQNTIWMIEHIPLEDEEDFEIEELDTLSSIVNLDQFSVVKECTSGDPSFNQLSDYKPRSRNVSQSSAMNEELEPIIKSATRSKWDSDYEESDEEKPIEITEEESGLHSELNQEIVANDNSKTDEVNDQMYTDTASDNLGVVPMEVEEEERLEDNDGGIQFVDKWEKEDSKECIQDSQEGPKQDSPDVVKKLASEYEEFMKMLGSEETIEHIKVDEGLVNNLNESSNLETIWDEEASKDNFVHNSASKNNSSQIQNNSQVSIEIGKEQSIEPVTSTGKQSWENQIQFSNRSRSLNSSRTHIMETVILKDKLMQEVLFRRKKKDKVQGSKIKKKSKDKYKKAKKKRKKESSSDSSSSSSSSSSDSSSSSSSSSSMSPSSEDSSSESSSSSDSTSSTDSSIDLKKLKKQKLKKLKSKLKQKKKKKISSSDSFDSSDEEIDKKRKKTKSKTIKKRKSKKKFKKNKKNKTLKASTNDSGNNKSSVFKKRLKKKRKKSDEEEEEDIDNIPKTKKTKLEIQLEGTILKKGKTGKSKNSSKLNKEKKKKDISKKEVGSKKKSSKDKSKLVEVSFEDCNSKSLKNKIKLKKGENKESQNFFLEFGQSPKTSKKSKASEIVLEKYIDDVKETGIKMSEEDFEPTTKHTDFEKVFQSTSEKSSKSNIEDRISFLGQNKRLTEEDFDKDLIEKIPDKPLKNEYKENKTEGYMVDSNEIVKLSTPFISNPLDKSKKKSKKEKKKKKDKLDLDTVVVADKKKKKNKKSGKSKKNSQNKNLDLNYNNSTIVTSLSEPKNLDNCEESSVSQVKTNTKGKNIITSKTQESWNKLCDFKSNVFPSCKLRPGPMNNWSDDSETRGFFEKQKNYNLLSPQEVFDDSPLKKRNLDFIEIPFIHFQSLSGDRYDTQPNFEKRNTEECEQKIDKLDDEFGFRNIANESDSLLENICSSTAELSPQVLPLVIKDSDSVSQASDDEDKAYNKDYDESVLKQLKNKIISIDINESMVSQTAHKDDILETDSKEIRLFSKFQEKDIATVNKNAPFLTALQDPEKDNDNSERYSPTLDMDVMSPGSNDKIGSDMSLDSNGADSGTAIETSLNMLDIPLPPTGLSVPSVPPLPPPLPTFLSPVPPPLLPVPPPSFKNILNLPSRELFTAQEIKQVSVIEEQPTNTEFKTTVTELTPTAATKPLFSDSLKIQMAKNLQFGKQVSKLKPINIFEDDDVEDENFSNQQKQNKFSFVVNASLIPKTSLELAIEKTEEGLRQNSKVEKLDIDIVNKLSNQQKMTENVQQQGTLKHNCTENRKLVNESRDMAHKIKSRDTQDIALNLVTTVPNKTDINHFVNNEKEKSKESEELSIREELHHEGKSDQLKDNEDTSSEDENLIVKKEVDPNDHTNNENIDSSNFDPHLEIKQEPESDVSQDIHSERIHFEESDVSLENKKSVLEEEWKKKDYEAYRNSRRRDSSRERRDRSRRDLSRDRRRNRSRSRSRERRRDKSRERYRRDSLDRRGKNQDRSKERSRKISPRDKRREKSPRIRRESSRDRSPRKSEGLNEVRMMSSEKKDSFRGEAVVEKRHPETLKTVGEKHTKLASPPRRSFSPYRNKSSPYRSPSPHKRSISPLIKSPLLQKRSMPSHFNRSPSPFKSSPTRRIIANRSPSPQSRVASPKRRLLSPQRRQLSPQRRQLSPLRRQLSPLRRPSSPQRRLISPQKRSQSPQWKPQSPKRRALSPQRRHLSPKRRPPSPQSPYRSPYRSPSPYGKHSPKRLSSPTTKRYLSPSRRPQSPWGPSSPLKRILSPSRCSLSPGKNSCSPLRTSSPSRRPPSPWRPPSPPNVQKKHKLKSPPSVQYSGRNPSPLGFKRSLADSTISDSDLPPIKKITRCAMLSPKRLPLDDRIELELGVKKSPPPEPPRIYPGFQSFYPIPVHDNSQLHLQSKQWRSTNLVQPPRLDWDASQQLMRGNSTQVVQVGNILQVVPTEALPAPVSVQSNVMPVPVSTTLASQVTSVKPASSESTVVQVGNMLQVVPSTVVAAVSASTPSPISASTPQPLISSPPSSPSVTVSSNSFCTNSPLLLPLPVAKKNIKIDETALRRIEKERRKREKEIKRQQKLNKHMLRKAMLLKDTYPTMSELECEEAKLAEEAEIEVEEPPKVLVTPIKVKGSAYLPPVPEKGILISPGFRDKPVAEKVRKTVSFADGVQPGEGDEASAEEHPQSPPPLPRFKKNKKKRKVKVRIIRVEDEDDEEDDSSPPPPPPGSPPPMFHYPPPPPGFMYVPPQSFTVLPGSEGLTPLYQQHHSSTTTTHTTTVQFAPATAPLPQKHTKAK